LHLFYNCPHANRYRTAFLEKFCPTLLNKTVGEMKLLWFCGIINNGNGNVKNSFLLSCLMLINYVIWDMKLRKTLTPISVFIENARCEIKKMINRSAYLMEDYERLRHIWRFE
jgi:hypothetical protein